MIRSIILSIALLTLTTACNTGAGSGDNPAAPTCNDPSCKGGNPTGSPTPDPNTGLTPEEITQELRKMDIRANVSGGHFDQALVIKLDPTSRTLELRVPTATNFKPAAGEFNNLPGTKFVITEEDPSSVSVFLPITYLLIHPDLGPEKGLPNGLNIPGTKNGQLSGVIASTTDAQLDFYLGAGEASLMVSTPNYNPAKNQGYVAKNGLEALKLGVFHFFGKTDLAPGGFLVTISLPEEKLLKLEKLFLD